MSLLLIAATPSIAADTEDLDLYIVNMPFSTALDVLGRDLGVKFTGDRSNRRRLKDVQLTGSQETIIDTVMEKARMDAFSFNGQVYYAPIEDRAIRLIPLVDGLTAERVFTALDAAGLLIPDYEISEVANGEALVMSGPVRYLALSEGVIDALQPEPDVAEPKVRVRRAGILETDLTRRAAVLSATE